MKGKEEERLKRGGTEEMEEPGSERRGLPEGEGPREVRRGWQRTQRQWERELTSDAHSPATQCLGSREKIKGMEESGKD